MFEIVFGFFVTLLTLYGFIMNIAGGSTGIDLVWTSLLLSSFLLVGGYFLVVGIRKIVRDRRTNLYGEICYARIIDVKFNGTSTNGAKYYDAYTKVYVESKDKFVEAHDVIGTDSNKYPIGSYVAVRYYEGDINFEYIVPSFDGLPMHIREKFDNGQIIPDDV